VCHFTESCEIKERLHLRLALESARGNALVSIEVFEDGNYSALIASCVLIGIREGSEFIIYFEEHAMIIFKTVKTITGLNIRMIFF
jgi:hypothetical protein